MLKTEQNTVAMSKRVEKAARAILKSRGVHSFFEHGQWWVQRGGKIWSVVDADGGKSVDGFDLELINDDDEELL